MRTGKLSEPEGDDKNGEDVDVECCRLDVRRAASDDLATAAVEGLPTPAAALPTGGGEAEFLLIEDLMTDYSYKKER